LTSVGFAFLSPPFFTQIGISGLVPALSFRPEKNVSVFPPPFCARFVFSPFSPPRPPLSLFYLSDAWMTRFFETGSPPFLLFFACPSLDLVSPPSTSLLFPALLLFVITHVEAPLPPRHSPPEGRIISFAVVFSTRVHGFKSHLRCPFTRKVPWLFPPRSLLAVGNP